MWAPWYHALQRFFQRAQWEGSSVPVVFAAPDRAHEELTRVIQRRQQGKARPTTALALSDRPYPAPWMSLWMTPPKHNPEEYNPGRVVVSKDRQRGTAVVMRWPKPMEATVQVELWCGDDAPHLKAQNISAQIVLQFPAQRAHLPVNWADPRWYKPPFNVLEHAKVLGPTRIRLISDGWDDNSDLEAGDEVKEVRYTWSGTVRGFIPYMPQEARLVREVRFELYDATDEENPVLIDTLISGSED